MKTIMVMFDSLNRHMLPPYGCDWVHAPNFQRLAERTVVFDHSYVCSMPSMPARRDLHTGRPNFLRRSWGPVEPFDDAWHLQDWKNREAMPTEEDQPQSRVFTAGVDYIRRNRDEDHWFLQIETFDPHEPFFSHRKFKDLYRGHYEGYDGPHFDWPPYNHVTEGRRMVDHIPHEYASLLSMGDSKLGDVLDRSRILRLKNAWSMTWFGGWRHATLLPNSMNGLGSAGTVRGHPSGRLFVSSIGKTSA